MKKLLLAGCLLFRIAAPCQVKEISSPDSRIRVTIEIRDSIRYAVWFGDQPVLLPSAIGMQLHDKSLGYRSVLKKATYVQVRDTLVPVVAEKRARITDHYNQVTLEFNTSFALLFRVCNDGVAYRFQTFRKDSLTVQNETAQYNFPANHLLYFPEVQLREGADIYHTSFEEPYQLQPLDSITPGRLLFSPVLVAPAAGPKIALTESDLEDYPGMFISGTGNHQLHGRFAPYPLETKMTEGDFPQYIVTKRADYIARTKGARSFPWRIMIIAATDNQLPATDIVYRLSSPSRIGDASWIRPGKGTDEWIIGINLFNVPFRSGVNTATYKYYIDFAKRFGFDRIMMDAGWSDYKDLFSINPAIDMDEIATYARQKGIRLSLWTLALTLDKQLEPALQQFEKWGVDFIMTDFMDRDDQEMVNFYYRVAEACARHRIMVMYHGAFKPAGFGRTFPNAVTREGVLGSEYNIWSDKATPTHNLLLPFIRMVAGPMDYEPGILDNATQKTFRPIGDKVMAPGTRCHQLAMFIVYESPVQLFSGNPSAALLEPAFMELLGGIPTTWDETIIPDARLGEYILTARKKGNDWYIAGMTNWTAREFSLSLGFLAPGQYTATLCEDGINADRYASDYRLSQAMYTEKDTIPVRMAPGGGFVIRLTRQ